MELTSRFNRALEFAAVCHSGQLRKGTKIPSGIALEYGADEEEAIAALLHDAVEDQKATIEEIRDRFGDAVADIVRGCSDTDVVPKPPWRKRKETYVNHIPAASPPVRLLSAADKLHNARAILRDYRDVGEALWERFNGGRDGTLWYYRRSSTRFGWRARHRWLKNSIASCLSWSGAPAPRDPVPEAGARGVPP